MSNDTETKPVVPADDAPDAPAVEQPAQKATRVLNTNNITSLMSSAGHHIIYTYDTKVDETGDLKRKGFFNPGYSFLNKGDYIRVFEYAQQDLHKFYEFIVMDVDKINKTVTVAIINERLLEKVTI